MTTYPERADRYLASQDAPADASLVPKSAAVDAAACEKDSPEIILQADQPLDSQPDSSHMTPQRRLLLRVERVVVQRPICVLIGIQCFLLAIFLFGFQLGDVHMDMMMFQETVSDASTLYDIKESVWDAMPEQTVFHQSLGSSQHPTGENDTAMFQKRVGPALSIELFLTFVYVCGGSCNLLDETRLYAIKGFEEKLQANRLHASVCQESLTRESPGRLPNCIGHSSILNFVWPEPMPTGWGASFVFAYAGMGCADLDGHSTFLGETESKEGCLYSCVDRAGDACNKFVYDADTGKCWWDYGLGCDQQASYPGANTYIREFMSPWSSIGYSNRLKDNQPIAFNGNGAQRLPWRFALDAASQQDGLLPSDFGMSPGKEPNSSLLQTKMAFEYMGDELEEVMKTGKKELAEFGITVHWHSYSLKQKELVKTLINDILLAGAGMLAVILAIRVQTKSWTVAILGMVFVFESLPLGLVLFQWSSGIHDISVINFLSAFIITGVGADLVFVSHGGWTRSGNVTDRLEGQSSDRWVMRRLGTMYRQAGMSCVATSVCCASSFLVNLVSSIKPLRDFGLFMGLSVLTCLVLTMLMLPLVFIVLERMYPTRSGGLSRLPDATAPGSKVAGGKTKKTPPTVKTQMLDFVFAVWPVSELKPLVQKESDELLDEFFRNYHIQVLAGFVIAGVIGAIGAVATIHLDLATPELFPDSHEIVVAESLRDEFREPDEMRAAGWMCSITSPHISGDCNDTSFTCSPESCTTGAGELMCRKTCGFCSECTSLWCMADEKPAEEQTDPGRCQCFSKSASPAFDGSQAIHTTFVGLDSSSWHTLKGRFEGIYKSTSFQGVQQRSREEDRPSLWQEHWRSGSGVVWPTFGVVHTIDNTDGSGNDIHQVCYCSGVTPCADPAQHAFNFSFDVQSSVVTEPTQAVEANATDESDLTNATNITVAETTRIPGQSSGLWIVWGVRVDFPDVTNFFPDTKSDAFWELDPYFDPADPWAQRSMMTMFEDMPESLLVQQRPIRTWMHEFADFLEARGKEFPSISFDEDIMEFLSDEGSCGSFCGDLWQDSSGKVRAIKVRVDIALDKMAITQKSIDCMAAWDDWVAEYNARANLNSRGAWHTSPVWKSIEVRMGIVDGTIWAVGISCFVGFAVAAAFTRSISLAALATVSPVLTIVMTFFVMCCLAGWAIGAVEAVSLIVFLGYMFSYNIHVSHAYSHLPENEQVELAKRLKQIRSKFEDHHDEADSVESAMSQQEMRSSLRREERLIRVCYAVSALGPDLLGSSVTTTSCAIFLLFCTLTFFPPFGVVISLVTCLSLVYSLVFLPSLFTACGPTSQACCDLGALQKALKELLGKKDAPEELEEVESEDESKSHCERDDQEAEFAEERVGEIASAAGPRTVNAECLTLTVTPAPAPRDDEEEV